MWGQTDLKKLVAYCTIQEMNLIVIFFLQGDNFCLLLGILFNITHTFLSTLMFFLIECVYIRYHSRSIFLVKGIFYSCTNLSIMIIFMIFFFSGIPGTLKFICEFYLFNLIFQNSWFLCFFLMIILNMIGLVGFSKNWYNAIFTTPDLKKKVINDLTKKEIYICLICFFNLLFFTYIPFLII
jgi:NADH:ubiquinone oxidoreductase subunit 4 (subunit M)